MGKPSISDIYKGSFASRPRFDDGGYVDYAAASPSATYMSGDNSGMPTSADIAAQTSGATTGNNSVPTETGDPGAGVANPGGSQGALGWLGSKQGSATLSALTSILSAAGHMQLAKANSKLPTMPGMLPSMPGAGTVSSGSYGPPGGYNYQNYQGATAGTPGLGFAPRTQAPARPASSYYTYGQGPEQQFFQQVSPNGAPTTPIPGGKRGGKVRKYAVGGMVDPMQPVGQPPMSGAPGQVAPSQLNMTGQPPMSGAPRQVAPSQLNMGTQPSPTMPQLGAPPANAPALGGGPGMSPPPAQVPQNPVAQQPAPVSPYTAPTNSPAGTAPLPARTPTLAPPPNAPPQPMPPGPRPMLNPQIGQGHTPMMNGPFGNRPMVGPAPRMGIQSPDRGRMNMMASGGSSGQTGALSAPEQGSRYVRGPGDGTSDDIPARLANGEYVLSADVVSGLGNGDNNSGAKVLDGFVKNLRTHKAENASKGKLPADAKPMHHYMGGKS